MPTYWYSSSSTSTTADYSCSGTSTASGISYYPYSTEYSNSYVTTNAVWVTPTVVPVETAEAKRVRLEAQRVREEQYRLETERRERERKEAVAVAEELLAEYVGKDRLAQARQVGHIDVDSQRHQGRKYRVSLEDERMIDVLDDKGVLIDRLCVHANLDCPNPDKVLTRLILLESDEDFILEKANHHGVPA